MNNPYIQSITISIPSDMVSDSRSHLSSLFKANYWGNYFKYGNTSLILINLYTSCPIFTQINQFIAFLKRDGILSMSLSFNQIKIHEIKMRFDIEIPGCIFCKTGYFLKVDKNTYRSNDTRKIIRKKDNWSKGRQQSFLTVTQYEDHRSTIIFTFSGKYAKNIPFEFLNSTYEELINNLCSLAGIYLTQATNPEGFKISRGYLPFCNEYFQKIITDANWFAPKFSRRYYKPNFFRGALL